MSDVSEAAFRAGYAAGGDWQAAFAAALADAWPLPAGANLQVESLAVTGTVRAGSNATVTWTTRNAGYTAELPYRTRIRCTPRDLRRVDGRARIGTSAR